MLRWLGTYMLMYILFHIANYFVGFQSTCFMGLAMIHTHLITSGE